MIHTSDVETESDKVSRPWWKQWCFYPTISHAINFMNRNEKGRQSRREKSLISSVLPSKKALNCIKVRIWVEMDLLVRVKVDVSLTKPKSKFQICIIVSSPLSTYRILYCGRIECSIYVSKNKNMEHGFKKMSF